MQSTQCGIQGRGGLRGGGGKATVAECAARFEAHPAPVRARKRQLLERAGVPFSAGGKPIGKIAGEVGVGVSAVACAVASPQ